QSDVLLHVLFAQPAKRESARHRLASEVGQQRSQRLAGDRVNVASSSDDEHACRTELAGEELEQEQRGCISGVKIVKDKDERPASGSRAKELGSRIEEAEARPFRVERRRLREVRELLPQLRDKVRHVPGTGPELGAQRGGIAGPNVGAE